MVDACSHFMICFGLCRERRVFTSEIFPSNRTFLYWSHLHMWTFDLSYGTSSTLPRSILPHSTSPTSLHPHVSPLRVSPFLWSRLLAPPPPLIVLRLPDLRSICPVVHVSGSPSRFVPIPLLFIVFGLNRHLVSCHPSSILFRVLDTSLRSKGSGKSFGQFPFLSTPTTLSGV